MYILHCSPSIMPNKKVPNASSKLFETLKKIPAADTVLHCRVALLPRGYCPQATPFVFGGVGSKFTMPRDIWPTPFFPMISHLFHLFIFSLTFHFYGFRYTVHIFLLLHCEATIWYSLFDFFASVFQAFKLSLYHAVFDYDHPGLSLLLKTWLVITVFFCFSSSGIGG